MTLTEVMYTVRRSLPFIIVLLVIIFLLYGILLFFININKHKTIITLNPTFGKIQQPQVANYLKFPQNPLFTLDTIQGKPIVATEAGRVFFIPKPRARFGYLQTIYLMARSVDFDTVIDTHQLSENIAIFSNTEQTLTIDVGNYNFTYDTQYENHPEYFSEAIIPDEDTVKQDANNFLSKMGRYPVDLHQGDNNIIYLAHTEDSKDFIVVKSPRQADVVEVDFFRPDIDTFPVVAPRYFNSQNYIVMTYKQGKMNVIKAQIKYFEKNDQSGNYPLLTGEEAWNNFIQGTGTVIANQNATNTISITEMYLGYLDIENYQPYLQPVYFFLGENNFIGFTPALRAEYLQ